MARVSLAIIVPIVLLVPCGLGYSFITALTLPGCGGGADPASRGLAYSEVRFPSSEFGRDIPAYWIPATPGVRTVIAVPTGGVARGDRLDEIAAYHRLGINVLTFSGRGCLAPVTNSLGYLDVLPVGDALAYLRTRPDVTQIGIHGFSAGGATAIMAAARYPELAWVVSAGGYHDFPAQIEQNTPYHLPLGMGALFRFGALLGYRLNVGLDMSVLSPINAIDDIDAPILLIYGTNEPGLAGARDMARIGGANVRLWEVPGAGHGNYVQVAGDEYARRIEAFLSAGDE